MDTFHFPKSKSRLIVHHARYAEPVVAVAASASSEPTQTQPQRRARHAREVIERTIEEHTSNRQVEVFIPTLATGADAAAAAAAQFDPLTYFRSSSAPAAAASSSSAATSVSPLFYYTCLLPFSSLLSDSFLSLLLSGGSCSSILGLSLRTSPDHSNVAQLSAGGILRLYLDTESFESLGVDAEGAHSEFSVCSQRGSSRSNVRERLVTIDLTAHAKHIASHATQPTTAAAADASSDATIADDASNKNKPRVDRKLDRLRWALNRCAPVRMQLIFLDAHGRCEEMPSISGITDIRRVDISPEVHEFGRTKGKAISVPAVAEFAQLLPSLEVVREVEQAKQTAKKQKRAATTEQNEEHKDGGDAVAAPASLVVSPSTSSSFFPSLTDGTCAQEIWTDMMTYLGLVHGRMESCLADPNNTSNSNLFLQQPLCPYLSFHTSIASSPSAAAAADGASMDIDEAEGEEEDVISLAPSSKKAKSAAAALKRKRSSGSDGATSSSSSSSLSRVSRCLSVRWRGGLLSSSFVSSLVSRARALLAENSAIPFVAITVWGHEQAITSWRDKQHQVWMAGSGSGAEAGGGENHYTILIFPESETERNQQQYVICTMLGELDRTH